jgi:NADH-quinone oxidoreductase subunit N
MITSISILFICAFLCLVLESLGAKTGERKIGKRNYIVLVALTGIIAAAYYLPTQSILGICTFLILMSLIVGVSQMRLANSELGEAYALILVTYALILLLCSTQNLIDFTVLTAFFNLSLLGLAYFKKNKRVVAEISLKLLFSGLFYFCFLSIAIAIALQSTGSTDFSVLTTHPEAKLALSFVWIALLLWIGSVPFLSSHVDYLDAAPSFASILFLGGSFITGGVLMSILCQHVLEPKLFDILIFFAGASLLLPPIFALDQQRIGRMVAYLLMTQSGVLLLLALFQVPVLPIFYLNISLVIPGALAGIRFWKHTRNSDKNWEDYAGAGRKHPFVGFCWLLILASLGGAPPTLGFWLYDQIAEAALKKDAFWILPLIVVAIIFSMIPIARLGVFMFAKPVRHEMILLHQPRQAFLIIACAALIVATNLICLAIPKIYEFQDLLPQLPTFQF